MRLVAWFLVAIALLVLSTGLTLGQPSTTGNPPPPDNHPQSSPKATGTESAEKMVALMVRIASPHYVLIPPNAKVGDWWEITTGKTAVRYSIVAERDKCLLIESEGLVGGEKIVSAWLVDPQVDMLKAPEVGKPVAANVKAAWLGVPGKTPVARAVQEAPVYVLPKPDGKTYKDGEEEIELIGKKWQAKWQETPNGKVWTLKGSAFVLMVRIGGRKDPAVCLTGMGDGATPLLKWDDVK